MKRTYADPVTKWRAWLVTQDARISRCPGCDDWQWDKTCNRCTTQQKAA